MDTEARLIGLEAKIDALYDRIMEIKSDEDMRILDLKQMAKLYGLSRQSLYNRKWLIPNFGDDMMMGSRAEWTRKEINDWVNAMPLEERKKQYFARALDSTKKALKK